MKKSFVTHNDDENIQIEGSCLQGYVDISYSDLVEIFGKPYLYNLETGDKVDAEWRIKFDDKTIATIYNYKDGHVYCGDDGNNVEDIRDWHIGGTSSKSYEMVFKCLRKEEEYK